MNTLKWRALDSPEGLCDAAWSEANQFQLATASADGAVCVWDLGSRADELGAIEFIVDHRVVKRRRKRIPAALQAR